MREGSSTPAAKPSANRARRAAAKAATLLGSLVVCAGILEGTFRVLEYREHAKEFHRGSGGRMVRDARWGWRISLGPFEEGTAEFAVKGDVNALSMNDDPPNPEADAKSTRILALGDSHTFATGTSMNEAWPKVLEHDLDAKSPGHRYRTFNAGTPGYNLHQYLLRLLDQGPLVKPNYVVVGFSYATDLYDLLPPDRGGWVYGWPDQPRDYFDFDASGALTERHWTPPTVAGDLGKKTGADASVYRIRGFLSNFAAFRYLWRSNLALALGSKVRVGAHSLWPNMDVVVNETLDEQQQYQWRLAQALLVRIKEETEKQGAKLVVAGIPYLPQIYDDLWRVTFASQPGKSPTAAIDRMREFCRAKGIAYVDTRDALRARVAAAGHWVHHRKDAHPNAEGQSVIAQTIADSGLLGPLE